MTVTEKVAYLKGLAEGMNLEAGKNETKLLSAVMDVLDDLALTVSDLEDEMALVSEQVDAVDEDLDELEGFVYDEDYDEDDCCCDECDDLDSDLYEVECPSCKETIYLDESILEDGGIECPNCGEKLEFEIEYDDEEDGCDDADAKE